ncbi:hypothetical protein GGI35DRAFT_374291 [Trichoderma velutinum]
MVKVLDGVDRIRKEDFWEEEKDGKYGGAGNWRKTSRSNGSLPVCLVPTARGTSALKGPVPTAKCGLLSVPRHLSKPLRQVLGTHARWPALTLCGLVHKMGSTVQSG